MYVHSKVELIELSKLRYFNIAFWNFHRVIEFVVYFQTLLVFNMVMEYSKKTIPYGYG